MGILNKKKTTKVSEEKKDVAVSDKKKTGASFSSVLVKPLVTEKSAILASKNAYVFAVAKSANKIEIAKAIRSMYGVIPEAVNVQNVRGKYVRRGKIDGYRKSWKKAIVILPAGKSLNIYEGV